MFAATLLSLEVVIILLTAMTVFGLRKADPTEVALVAGVVGVLAIVAAAALRSGIGYTIGWAVQVLLVASGFLIPSMWVLGGIFLVMWAWALATGARIDRERAERETGTAPTSCEAASGEATLDA